MPMIRPPPRRRWSSAIRTSYMAGRLRQMRDPDMVRMRPFWQYRHAETRVPLAPREEHVRWNNLVLDWNDPWWDIHFPPNDWQCSCGVRTLSRGDLKRLGKAGPDTAPEIVRRPHLDKTSGQIVQLPEGVGFGWDYMPGDHWQRGLVPSAILNDPQATALTDLRGRLVVSIDQPEPMADLLAKARKFKAEVLPADLPEEAYAAELLKPFGTEIGKPILWEDVSGTRIVISEDIFKTHSGEWKALKRGHGDHAALIAEAIMDPDEIWLGVREVPDKDHPGYSEIMVTRRYIRVDPNSALFVLYEIGRRAWGAITGYGSLSKAKPDFNHIEKQRIGKLLWKRD